MLFMLSAQRGCMNSPPKATLVIQLEPAGAGLGNKTAQAEKLKSFAMSQFVTDFLAVMTDQ